MTADSHQLTKAEFNFLRWKTAVGLPETFPELSELSDDQLDRDIGYFESYAHKKVNQDIVNAIHVPRVVVLVTKGHGCTTAARFLHRKLKNDVTIVAKRIPILIRLDRLDHSAEDFIEAVTGTIRREVVQSLVAQDGWEPALGRRVYADLIGAIGRSLDDITPQRMELAHACGIRLQHRDLAPSTAAVVVPRTPDWPAVKAIAPTLGLPLDELLVQLARDFDLGVSLQIDLSCRSLQDNDEVYTSDYFDNARKLSSVIKILTEQVGRRIGIRTEPSLSRGQSSLPLGLMVFTGDDGFDGFTAEWDQVYERFEYPFYGPTDVFAILSYHYPQKTTTSGLMRREALSAVIDSEIVQNVSSEEKSLNRITLDLTREILKQMWDWTKVGVRLALQRS